MRFLEQLSMKSNIIIWNGMIRLEFQNTAPCSYQMDNWLQCTSEKRRATSAYATF